MNNNMATSAFESVPINRKDIKQELLNIENRARKSIFPWRGQFSPQLIEAMLANYATDRAVIFDPFLGSGTVLYESGSMGLEAYGTEINPSAYILSKTFSFINVNKEIRKSSLNVVERIVDEIHDAHYMRSNCSADNLDEEIRVRLINALPLFDQKQQVILESLIVLLDFHNNKLNPNLVLSAFAKIKQTIMELPFSAIVIDAYNSDARDVPLPDKSIDLVITSPPYINVFNYHQNYRRSVEALGWDILDVAKSEFGSNRKHRGNRFLTVIQYCMDMALTFLELKRVLKEGGQMIFIVGRVSKVKGTPFYNAKIISEIATQAAGIELKKRQERVFVNQFGQSIYEDILHFNNQPSDPDKDAKEKARELAICTLHDALVDAPDKERGAIQNAIEKAHAIYPSPIFNCAQKGEKLCCTQPPTTRN